MDSIRTYRFTMLREGAIRQDGDTFTYTGPCDLEVEIPIDGGIQHFFPTRASRTVSWTWPAPLAPAPARAPADEVSTTPVPIIPTPTSTVPVAAAPAIPILVDPVPAAAAAEVMSPNGPTDIFGSPHPIEPVVDTLSVSKGKRKRSMEEEDETAWDVDRAAPSRVCRGLDCEGHSSESKMGSPAEESEPMEDEEYAGEAVADDDCVELVNIESSREVVFLSSDSDSDGDPSEDSGAPWYFGAGL